MSVRREHFTPAEKPKPIEDMIAAREEIRVGRWQDRPEDAVETAPTPLKPLLDIGILVEEANALLMKAAKIATAAEIPEAHEYVTAARSGTLECHQKLAAITARSDES